MLARKMEYMARMKQSADKLKDFILRTKKIKDKNQEPGLQEYDKSDDYLKSLVSILDFIA